MTCAECKYYIGPGEGWGYCHALPPQIAGATVYRKEWGDDFNGDRPVWMRPTVYDNDAACKYYLTHDDDPDVIRMV